MYTYNVITVCIHVNAHIQLYYIALIKVHMYMPHTFTCTHAFIGYR